MNKPMDIFKVKKQPTQLFHVKRVQQPTHWSCLPAVASMITGEPIWDIFKKIGHDGKPVGIEGEKGFEFCEIVSYLASKNLLLGRPFHLLNIPGDDDDTIYCQSSKRTPALLIVQPFMYPSRTKTHAVYWTGSVILDPHPDRTTTRDLDDYLILQWWPIMRVV